MSWCEGGVTTICLTLHLAHIYIITRSALTWCYMCCSMNNCPLCLSIGDRHLLLVIGIGMSWQGKSWRKWDWQSFHCSFSYDFMVFSLLHEDQYVIIDLFLLFSELLDRFETLFITNGVATIIDKTSLWEDFLINKTRDLIGLSFTSDILLDRAHQRGGICIWCQWPFLLFYQL